MYNIPKGNSSAYRYRIYVRLDLSYRESKMIWEVELSDNDSEIN
jgi:hypothetical protein